MNTKLWIISLCLVLAVCFCLIPEGTCALKSEKTAKPRMSLATVFFGKVNLILYKSDKLGLTDEQLSKIKHLKLEVKKDYIMKKAQINVVDIEMNAVLSEERIDKSRIGTLIDQKYELEKEKAKLIIEGYATLKDILTASQKKILAQLWKAYKAKITSGAKTDVKAYKE